MVRHVSLAESCEHLGNGFLWQTTELQWAHPLPYQLFQSSDQCRRPIGVSITISPDDNNRKLNDAVDEMNQESERRFVGPVKVFQDIHVRTRSGGALERLGEA